MSTEQDKYKSTSTAQGAWLRSPTKFHSRISSDPNAEYPAEPNRYRLYASYACPWAHRTLITRKLKGLENCISLTVTGYELAHLGLSPEQSEEYKGWNFIDTKDESSVHFEPHGFNFLGQLYEHASPNYKKTYKELNQRPVYSVPVLFDEKTQTIVSNESAEIIELLNDCFNDFSSKPTLDLKPKKLQSEMSEINSIVYPGINDGVYRCGFARSQTAYEEAFVSHWKAMDEIEHLLSSDKRPFLTGDTFTLSDIRLFVTLVRYDAVYYSHFKTSRNRITEMPFLFNFLKRVYNLENIKETVNIEHIVKHYYGSQRMINPSGIWPLGSLQKDSLKYLEEGEEEENKALL